MIKGLVSFDTSKDEMSKLNEVVNLDSVYSLMGEIASVSSFEEKKDDIFKTFEKELGRTMSSMELEIINGWLSSGASEEIVLQIKLSMNGVKKGLKQWMMLINI